MTLSLALFFLWAFTANVLAMFPSRRHHWPAAYVLVATGIPLIIFIFYQNSTFISLLVLAAWCSVLRWPILYGYKRIRKLFEGESQ